MRSRRWRLKDELQYQRLQIILVHITTQRRTTPMIWNGAGASLHAKFSKSPCWETFTAKNRSGSRVATVSGWRSSTPISVRREQNIDAWISKKEWSSCESVFYLKSQSRKKSEHDVIQQKIRSDKVNSRYVRHFRKVAIRNVKLQYCKLPSRHLIDISGWKWSVEGGSSVSLTTFLQRFLSSKAKSSDGRGIVFRRYSQRLLTCDQREFRIFFWRFNFDTMKSSFDSIDAECYQFADTSSSFLLWLLNANHSQNSRWSSLCEISYPFLSHVSTPTTRRSDEEGPKSYLVFIRRMNCRSEVSTGACRLV